MKNPEGVLVLSHLDGTALSVDEINQVKQTIQGLAKSGSFEIVPFMLSTGVKVQYIPLSKDFDPSLQIVGGTIRILDTVTSETVEVGWDTQGKV